MRFKLKIWIPTLETTEQSNSSKIEKLQNKSIIIINFKYYEDPCNFLVTSFKLKDIITY